MNENPRPLRVYVEATALSMALGCLWIALTAAKVFS